MPDLTQRSKYADFSITSTAGEARTGELVVGEKKFETPMLFPVINFYGGGRKGSLFGGSTHRTVKELINGDDCVGGVSCSEYFPGSMLSVGSLTDYGISESLLKTYLEKPISERPEFSGFEGLLFVDSGGFKNLSQGGLDGSDFQMELNQHRVFDMQRQLGGDILVNLDLPITEDDTYEERIEKAKTTAENAVEFARHTQSYPCAAYLSVHGYDYSMIDTFFEQVESVFGSLDLTEIFDGIALGSLVPKKDNKSTLIEAISGCKQVMAERGFENHPLHVLGISGKSMPLLVGLGVDSFDSSSYIQAAINGKYYTSFLETERVDDVDLTKCDCPVCSSPLLRERMKGNAEYRKDQMGPVAVHNMIIQQKELSRMRKLIQSGPEAFVDYLGNELGRHRSVGRYAHDVVNKSFGGYDGI
ncbi:tRNA-guanine transglycosylase [Haladaptatus sp. DJG-WS-42]|uniref:tRNA-guanine transglycosylase n=1 Tax=Haladaptatus sp. DJG-WS-42 TaxID=3120516 RepID=UPI0030CDDA26